MNHHAGQQSESINELAGALARAQSAIPPAPKAAWNPHFKSHYADLTSIWDACRLPLAENGLAVIQGIEPLVPDAIAVRTTLTHASGQWVTSLTPLLLSKQDMQGMGSAITYARRYALAAMVGVVADLDDDGHAASSRDGGSARQGTPPAPSRQPSSPSRGPDHRADATTPQADRTIRWGEWLDRTFRESNQRHADRMRRLFDLGRIPSANDPAGPLIAHADQIINHIVSAMIAGEALDPKIVQNDDGKRDKAKAREAARKGYEIDPGWISENVTAWAKQKHEDRIAAMTRSDEADPPHPDEVASAPPREREPGED
jgi:hypothetical protein